MMGSLHRGARLLRDFNAQHLGQSLVERKSDRGQSMLLAISKGIGTAAITICFGIIGNYGPPSVLVLILGLICFFLDVAYVFMLLDLKNRKSPFKLAS